MCKFYSVMDGEKFEEKYHGLFLKCSNLLELAAADDVSGFIYMVEQKDARLDEISFWYVRRNGFNKGKMGLEERTPLMIAAMYGSTQVLKYIINAKKVDVNKTSDSDGATALHCAAAGGSPISVGVVKLLLEASADVNVTDANGNKPGDLIARGIKSSKRRALEMLLKGFAIEDAEQTEEKEIEIVAAKKEYPVDVSMPDINNGVYGSDEFRMYTFKVKPCSRAYTHDWTECPFVHPGENARRRDLQKFNYSCVPCPEFRKGSCVKGDSCEYAHGVFESWLHPAQYRTRLCKDEIGCARKVCFFAHRVEELRPVYASTGSAMPSPKSGNSMEISMGSMSPLALGSTPPMSPPSSPMWQHLTPPALQLPGSRLKTALNARDLEIDMELLGSESIRAQQQQRRQMIDDLSTTNLYNSNRFGELKPTNLDDVFGSRDQSLLSQFHGLSPKVSSSMTNTPTQLQSPTGHQQFRQNSNHLRASYPSPNYSSSPVRKQASYGFDSSAAVAQAVMNSRSGSFSKQRSQSFVDRGAGATMSLRSIPQQPSNWGSPDGKLEWGFSGGDDANKLRKSASFGYGGTGGAVNMNHEPDVSWVNTLVKDVGVGLHSSPEKHRYGGGGEKLPQWIEQMYIEQKQMVA